MHRNQPYNYEHRHVCTYVCVCLCKLTTFCNNNNCNIGFVASIRMYVSSCVYDAINCIVRAVNDFTHST